MRLIKKTLKWIVVAFFASTILSVVALRFLPVVVTPLMLIRCYEQVKAGEELKLSHDWEPLSNISKDLPIAVMASEDAKFLDHHGFDYQAIEHAAKRNREHPEKRKLGASTISQQTAKNVFLWPGRSWVRKGFEVYFTALIELMWPKERIMEETKAYPEGDEVCRTDGYQPYCCQLIGPFHCSCWTVLFQLGLTSL